ncbi:MAG TPA: hypothetical protein VFS12_05480 [Terriglobia bacterium]|nr:hypothetical protein [Terriglobia bacterium]
MSDSRAMVEGAIQQFDSALVAFQWLLRSVTPAKAGIQTALPEAQ